MALHTTMRDHHHHHHQHQQQQQDEQQQQQHQRFSQQEQNGDELQAALNLLDHPVWIFDIVKRAMWFANDEAVALWSADSLDALLERDFSSDMSHATKNRLDDYLLKLSQGETLKEQWTFYPNNNNDDANSNNKAEQPAKSPRIAKTVDCTCKGIHIEEGRLAMLVQGVYKHEAESTMTEAEKEALRAVEMLRHLPIAVCMTDLEGNVMEQNPEALAVFGSVDTVSKERQADKKDNSHSSESTSSNSATDDDDDATTSTFIKRFVDEDLGRRILHQARTKSAQEDSSNVISLEALQHTVYGPRWSAIQVRQTTDPVNSKPILLYSARDITAVVKAKRQAVAADGAKTDLLVNMAHAIRTPLQHVVGVVELLSHQSKQHQLLQSSAQLLMTVIHDLMANVGGGSGTGTARCSFKDDTSAGSIGDILEQHDGDNKHNHNKQTQMIRLEHAHLDVKQILDSVVATITPQANVKDVSVQVKVSKSITAACQIMGDANRLSQILFEILHNAVKYTSGGNISVSVRRLSNRSSRRVRLRFEVKDSGVGLNLEQQQQCMKTREWRERENKGEEVAETNAADGVGLGLCKSLVDAMGGEIGVLSKPGQGSTFFFEVPFLKAAAAKPSKSTLASTLPSSSLEAVPDDGGLQILLVDQDNVGRTVMQTLLEESGHDVTPADNGDAMIRAVAQGSYDVVLLETQLPLSSTVDGSSGCNFSTLDATREVRKMGFSAESLPILALTAAVPRADYPELGLNDWLTKPILSKDVQKAMTNAICNVDTKSVGAGSVFTDTSYSLNVRATSSRHSDPALHGSDALDSIHSIFSDHLQACVASPDAFTASAGPGEALPTPISTSTTAPCQSPDGTTKQKADRAPKMVGRSLIQQ